MISEHPDPDKKITRELAGEMNKAKEHFMIVKEQDQSEEVQATVDSYLKEME